MKLILHFRKGTLRTIYNDALRPLLREGEAKVQRASHVEPGIASNTWDADMGPVGGPLLRGYRSRGAALRAEAQYLERNVL